MVSKTRSVLKGFINMKQGKEKVGGGRQAEHRPALDSSDMVLFPYLGHPPPPTPPVRPSTAAALPPAFMHPLASENLIQLNTPCLQWPFDRTT